jgi:hypothetical protein
LLSSVLYRTGLARSRSNQELLTPTLAARGFFFKDFTDNRKEQPMPGKGRPFQKGISGNPGGRPKVLGDVQELARQKSPEAITTLANIMNDEKAPPAARVAAANALLDRGYRKPTQPISQTLAKVDPSTISDEELAAIAMNGGSVNAPAH